jgi:DMSO/TMAO reductase YedYZ molybdopterin-dependent catalytic subunit
MDKKPEGFPLRRLLDRRRVIQMAAAGAVVVLGKGLLGLMAGDEETRKVAGETLPDGRKRLPPGQRLVKWLQPMGGAPGSPNPEDFRLRISGEVERPLELDYRKLLSMPQVAQTCDVHCVTTWTCLDVGWTGVSVARLAELAGVKETARYAIFEAAHGYTTNVPLPEALKPDVLVAHRLNGEPLPLENGPPVRALLPGLYFWKSAKWLTGIRFSATDEPGYWEVRGYNNHGDPWREERYA